MHKFPKIDQFRQVIREVRSRTEFAGLDENGEPIMERGKPLPKIQYRGTVKLHGCVSSTTEVLLPDGTSKPISELKIGGSILSFNEKTGQMEVDTVIAVMSQVLDKKWVELEFDNGYTLQCTEDHRVYTKNRGYVAAKDLTNKDEFLSDCG